MRARVEGGCTCLVWCRTEACTRTRSHLHALLKMAKQQGVERVFIHAFMDGRDTLPTNGAGYLELLQQKIREYNVGKIASVNGRYYAMDRDRRWERMAKAFHAMTYGEGEGGKYVDPVQGVKDSYNKDVTDEFIVPFVCVDNRGEPLTTIRDEDSCICFNFRADRVRQVTRALARNSGINDQDGRDLPGAEDLDSTIPRDRVPKNLTYVCMTQYDKKFNLADGDSAGIDGQHPGQRDGPDEYAKPARGGDRKVCARDLFL